MNEAYELRERMIIAADMIANLEDRKLVYALINAAEKSIKFGWNPRKVFYGQREGFPHIKLNMDYKNWS